CRLRPEDVLQAEKLVPAPLPCWLQVSPVDPRVDRLPFHADLVGRFLGGEQVLAHRATTPMPSAMMSASHGHCSNGHLWRRGRSQWQGQSSSEHTQPSLTQMINSRSTNARMLVASQIGQRNLSLRISSMSPIA